MNVLSKWDALLRKCSELKPDFKLNFAQLLNTQSSVGPLHHVVPIMRNTFPHLGTINLVRQHWYITGAKTTLIDNIARSIIGSCSNEKAALGNLPIAICNYIIRSIDQLVIDRMVASATSFASVTEAIRMTNATWIAAESDVIAHSPLLHGAVITQSIFDAIYDGGYRSKIKCVGHFNLIKLFVVDGLGDKILVGNSDGCFFGVGIPFVEYPDFGSIRSLDSNIKIVSELSVKLNPKFFGVVLSKSSKGAS